MAASAHFGDYLREHWSALKSGRPGHRFVERYERAREAEQDNGAGKRVLMIAGGCVALAIGLVLMVFPGPAVPFFFLAGALLATESRTIARGMDWAEVRGRRIADWVEQRWERLPWPVQIALLILGGTASLAALVLGYRWLQG